MAQDREEEHEEEETLKANADFEFLVEELYNFVLFSHDFEHLRQSDRLVSTRTLIS